MTSSSPRRSPSPSPSLALLAPTVAVALLAVAIAPGPAAWADQVVLKNGGLITGIAERDNAYIIVYDGLKRTVIRQTKVDRIVPEPASERQKEERFSLVQPLEVHGGEMPSHAIRIRASEWDELGRRTFEYSWYSGRSLRSNRMTQAINEIGPDLVKFRGIDGFWVSQVATSQVPRSVILGLLDRVDPTNKNERLRVGRFLIQAKWYDEALAELDRLGDRFPELSGTVALVRTTVRDLQAEQAIAEASRMIAVGQPNGAERRLAEFDAEGVSVTVRDDLERTLLEIRQEAESHRRFGSDLRAALVASPEEFRRDFGSAVTEILQAIDAVPDAVADRLAPARPAVGEDGTPIPPQVRLCRALSSWVVGPEHAVDDAESVRALWDARDRILSYLASSDPAERDRLRSELEGGVSSADGTPTAAVDLETASRLIRRLFPPLASVNPPKPGEPTMLRVIDDPNVTPTEYGVLLPPEYHPMRPYPAVVALHDGRGARSALDWWGPEAARHGFIVIAPEYLRADDEPDYRYSSDEHAAVLLSLRDARKRLSIDPDRIFVAGSMIGGNASWDIGLAHPDVFAGAVTLSGLPAKHVGKTRVHAEFVPLYVAIGDMATASTDAMVFEMVKGLISKAWDVTYVEYFKRGLEPLPEELPAAFDWMSRRTRTPRLKQFEVVASRPGDDRYFGLVIRGFSPGHTPDPGTVDVFGTKLDPATLQCKVSQASNLMSLTVSGITALDVWLDPEYFDFDDRIQIRVNGKRLLYDRVKPDLGALLEDVRIRGDRTQLYWAKIPLGDR
ncbi:carboxylesterase family protein [Tautonia sociabilis]|uniref:Alpha/beta hydrolase n=1 Tax=Tautonia sociabilis TaxID=2080755 RepID=A0A432MKH8_9BACT|nr:alpha/beta hydrolase [Tautonia sociabilis]RUL87717.1 alpha/beta hydrolase [Tautonia sociabilis]